MVVYYLPKKFRKSQSECKWYDKFALTSRRISEILERLSLTLRGLTSNGKRQSWPLKFINPLLNHINLEKCLLLFATNTNIFTLLFKELNTDGKSFIFAVCRLTYDHVTPNLISLLYGTSWKVVQNFHPKYVLTICNSSPLPAAILELWSDRTRLRFSR